MLFWVLEVIAVIGLVLTSVMCYKFSRKSHRWLLTSVTVLVFLALVVGCIFTKNVNTTSFVAFDVWMLTFILYAVRKTDKSCM